MMRVHLKTTLSVLVGAILLNACASGKGGFELDNVNSLNTQGASQNSALTPTTTPKTPTYQDEQNTRRTLDVDTQEPALGYAVEVPRRVFAMRDTPPEELTVNITPDKVKPTNHKLEDLPKVFSETLVEHPKYVEDSLSYSHDVKSKDAIRDLQFVRSGYVIAEKGIEFDRTGGAFRQNPAGQYGHVFYQGVNPATALPTTNVTYQGTWDFVSNAISTRRDLPEGFTNDLMNYGAKGNTVGATSLDADVNRGHDNDKPTGLKSTFEVNFADKKMTGKFIQNHGATNENAEQTITDRYSVEATLKGNRFVGTANAMNKEHAIFGQNGALEGGFFGAKAEELGGKFLAEDGSLFGVFAGKRGVVDKVQTQFDATAIDSKTLTKTNMDTFGQASHLVIDGKRVSLLPEGVSSFADMKFIDTHQVAHGDKKLSVTVCCNNLDYVKFGGYGTVGGTADTPVLSDGKLFLVGERTDTSAIPTSGTAHYRGTWEGYIDSKDGRRWTSSASDLTTGTRSRFDVDFGLKSLIGKLIADNGLEDNPVLTLNGTITGNGFSGTAKTGVNGFNLDPNSTGASAIAHINADFHGGFYGVNALELGGVIHHDKAGEDKIGVVFGGKRQTNTP